MNTMALPDVNPVQEFFAAARRGDMAEKAAAYEFAKVRGYVVEKAEFWALITNGMVRR